MRDLTWARLKEELVRSLQIYKYFKYLQLLWQEERLKFKNELSVVCIIKNEAEYLREWLEFHLLVGVGKFFVYDNGSTDNTRKILQHYIQQGVVEYTWFPGERKQIPACVDVIKKCKSETKWLLPMDVDEFVLPLTNGTIPEFLRTISKNSRQIRIGWEVYGSGGRKKKEKGLVIKRFLYRSSEKILTRLKRHCAFYKSIINPRFVVYPHVHHHWVMGETVNENGVLLSGVNLKSSFFLPKQKIKINHYWIKSEEEFEKRWSKGDAVYGSKRRIKKMAKERFNERDLNDVYEPVPVQLIMGVSNKLREKSKRQDK